MKRRTRGPIMERIEPRANIRPELMPDELPYQGPYPGTFRMLESIGTAVLANGSTFGGYTYLAKLNMRCPSARAYKRGELVTLTPKALIGGAWYDNSHTYYGPMRKLAAGPIMWRRVWPS